VLCPVHSSHAADAEELQDAIPRVIDQGQGKRGR
jgi:hypothetical protein